MSKKEEKKVENIEGTKNEKDLLIENLTNQVKELTDKNMRVQAEMINTIRRKDEELNRMLKYASEDIIKELLIVIDNFERALNVEVNEELSNYMQGMKMIYDNILRILTSNEVKEIDCLGKEFNADYMAAVMKEKKEGVKENEVIEVLQKGYTYKDKIIRPAMVKVNG